MSALIERIISPFHMASSKRVYKLLPTRMSRTERKALDRFKAAARARRDLA